METPLRRTSDNHLLGVGVVLLLEFVTLTLAHASSGDFPGMTNSSSWSSGALYRGLCQVHVGMLGYLAFTIFYLGCCAPGLPVRPLIIATIACSTLLIGELCSVVRSCQFLSVFHGDPWELMAPLLLVRTLEGLSIPFIWAGAIAQRSATEQPTKLSVVMVAGRVLVGALAGDIILCTLLQFPNPQSVLSFLQDAVHPKFGPDAVTTMRAVYSTLSAFLLGWCGVEAALPTRSNGVIPRYGSRIHVIIPVYVCLWPLGIMIEFVSIFKKPLAEVDALPGIFWHQAWFPLAYTATTMAFAISASLVFRRQPIGDSKERRP